MSRSGQNQQPENWQAAQHAAKLANQNNTPQTRKRTAEQTDVDEEPEDDYQNSYFDEDASDDDSDDDDADTGDEGFSSGFDLKSKAFDLIAKRVKLWVIGAICPPIGLGAAAITAVLDETTSSKDKS